LPLLVVATGVGISLLQPLINPAWALKPTQIVQIPANIFGQISLPDFSKVWSDARIFKDAFTIGLALSIYFIVRNNFKAEYKIERHQKSVTQYYYIKLNSMVTFLNKVNLQNTLYKVPPYSVLTIDGSDSRFIDYDVLEMISEYEKQAHEKHIELILKNIERVQVISLH